MNHFNILYPNRTHRQLKKSPQVLIFQDLRGFTLSLELGVFFVAVNYIYLGFIQIHAHFYINYIIYYGLLIFCCQNVAININLINIWQYFFNYITCHNSTCIRSKSTRIFFSISFFSICKVLNTFCNKPPCPERCRC